MNSSAQCTAAAPLTASSPPPAGRGPHGGQHLRHEHQQFLQRGKMRDLPGRHVLHAACHTSEAYLPVLAALGRLCRAPDGQRVLEVLDQQAPTWLVQLPALLGTAKLAALQRRTHGVTRERMLRELAEAVETLPGVEAVREPPLLVLVLEDLQWSDVSTLDWLAFVARRREPARLLVIGTYRPVDVLVREHPLRAIKQELQVHGYCTELLLDFLTEAHVAEYLTTWFGVGAVREPPLRVLAHAIHRRTDGNPLFMVNVVDDLVARGVLVQSDGRWELQGGIEESIGRVPESLQQLIEQQIERLSPEVQRLLEVGSVAGAEFSAAAVAAGMETEIDVIEDQCEALVRRERFLQANGTAEWPDGTVAARYGFLHALYQEVLYHRLTAGRRQRLHQQVGTREEQGYGDRAREIAAELAVHFERGRNYPKAIQYLQQAGANAVRRSANQEAISLLTKGLELLKTLPDTPERTQQELRLQLALSTPLIATKGYAAPEVAKAYARAHELCQQVGETPQLFRVLPGLHSFYFNCGEFQTARELAEQLFSLAQSVRNPSLLMRAHSALGTTLFRLGELAPAQEQLEQALALYNPQEDNPSASGFVHDIRIANLSHAAWNLWLLGYPDQALQRSHAALAAAQELSHPFSLAWAFGFVGEVHQFRREGQLTQERAEAAIALSTEHGFPTWLAMGTLLRGWALAEQASLSGRQEQAEEGITQMRRVLAIYRATGAGSSRSHFLALLAEAHWKVGQAEKGLAVLAEALDVVDKSGGRWCEAELYRLKGELTLQSSVQSPESRVKEAEECFRKAIEIARKQQAKSWELRAVMSLSRLWQSQGKMAEARQMLAEIYHWFTEGFDTKDLHEAKALLEELER